MFLHKNFIVNFLLVKIVKENHHTKKGGIVMNKQSTYETAKAEISNTATDPKDYERQVKALARKIKI